MDQLLKMVRPDRLVAARKLAHSTGLDIFDALDDIRASEEKLTYFRRKPTRPILPPRRPEEEWKNQRRYIHPPSLMPMIAGDPPLRHIPVTSQLLIPRTRHVEKVLG